MKKLLLLLWLCCFLLSIANAQTREITGQVFNNETGEKLAGASVTLKGTTKVTITGPGGKLAITVPGTGTPVLQIKSVGFAQQEITVTIQTSVLIKLLVD